MTELFINKKTDSCIPSVLRGQVLVVFINRRKRFQSSRHSRKRCAHPATRQSVPSLLPTAKAGNDWATCPDQDAWSWSRKVIVCWFFLFRNRFMQVAVAFLIFLGLSMVLRLIIHRRPWKSKTVVITAASEFSKSTGGPFLQKRDEEREKKEKKQIFPIVFEHFSTVRSGRQEEQIKRKRQWRWVLYRTIPGLHVRAACTCMEAGKIE